MSTHPLLPTETFETGRGIGVLFQTFYTAKQGTNSIVSFLGRSVVHFIAQVIGETGGIHLALPFATYTSLPAKCLYRNKYKQLAKIIAPLSCSATMAAITFAADTLHTKSSSILIKGLIQGVHEISMCTLAYSPTVLTGHITLKGLLINVLCNHNDTPTIESQDDAEQLASTAFAISTIAFTCYYKNPIVGTTLAYVIAALTKGVTQYYFNPRPYAIPLQASRRWQDEAGLPSTD